ncbi:MAG: hypothetical protein IJH55_07580 [Romboutsia sp.]|nr:hypothetical protein [Romboutsia sp.]
MNDNGLSAADIAAVVDNNRGYGYPYPMYNNGGFGSGFGNGDWSWIIILLILCGGYGGFGFGGGFGGFGAGMDFMYPWLANGQQAIMNNTNNGFDTLHLSNQIEGVRDGIYGISNQLCNCCADMNQTVSAGFANAETAANSRQMANMQQAYTNQIATLQGFNGVTSQLANASADNRLGIANLNSTILAENCADRAALQEGVRDIITNATSNTQAVLDKLCQLELDGVKAQLDAKNDKIQDLQRENLMKDLQASQTAQNAFIAQGFSDEVDQLYNRLSNCPVPSTPVYRKNTNIYMQQQWMWMQ